MDVDGTSSADELDDALARRFDSLDGQPTRAADADRLIRDHAPDLLGLRRDAVLERLASPDRGPGLVGASAVAAVLRVLGPTPAIERAWLRWIDEGRFDKLRPDELGSTSAFDLTDSLRGLVDDGVLTEDHALVHATLAHWSGLLRHPETRHREQGRRVIGALLTTRRPFPTALPTMVLRALRGDPSSEASALRLTADAVEAARGRGSR